MPKLTNEVINAAIEGFKARKTRINERIAELSAMLSPKSAQSSPITQAALTKRRKFSTSARRRMREAQRLRWAKIRGETAEAGKHSAKPERRISKQGLQNIIAATKRRWALKRLEAAKAKKAAA
jgi:hypothetical protein